jgi:hypothetical protein
MQAACRQFLTDTQAIEQLGFSVSDIQYGGSGSWLFNQAIGALRGRIGTAVAVVVAIFDVEVDRHLAKLLPPPVEGHG